TFSVAGCPLCYSCPVGTLHPITGQCCDNGMCDAWLAGNFGPRFLNSAKCQQFTFPGSTKTWQDFDCIGTNYAPISGSGAGAAQMIAVSFTPQQAGQLRHIQAPIGWQSGTNSLLVWITADSNNAPAGVIEALTVFNVRVQPAPTTVDAPAHIFSSTHPQLAAGTRYWLVMGPGANDTQIAWNLSLDDISTPGMTTFLLNTTNSSVAGPWAPKSNLQELRPAFEIDIR
ncbi:MAG TPA: choice-of-anchor R domain-containing protein, partial [Sphingomicrobium sp.]|nr:choice-of-anchor R domain-containing protein [Sphingomicrobium sp.]